MKTKKKWKNIKVNQVHLGTFDFAVNFVVGDYKEACEYVVWKFDNIKIDFEKEDNRFIPRGKSFFLNGYCPIIWIPKIPKTSREQATYAHECLHAIFHLFEWAGIPLTKDTEEVMTHAMSCLITNGLSKLKII